MDAISAFFERLERRPYYAYRVILTAAFVAAVRYLEERLLGHEGMNITHFLEYGVWYLGMFFQLSLIAGWLVTRDWRAASQMVAYGILLGTLPPLIDVLWLGPGNFDYTYLYEFSPWFVHAELPMGETITVWLSIAAMAFYIAVRTRSPWRTATGVAAIWIGFQVMSSWLPMLSKYIFREGIYEAGEVVSTSTARNLVFGSYAYLLYLAMNARRLGSSLRRITHSTPWVLVALLGGAVAGEIDARVVFYAWSVLLVHQAAIFLNDYYDRGIDDVERRRGGVDADDVVVFQTLALWIPLTVVADSSILAVLLVLYTVGTTAYHHHSIRLKQVCPANYKSEGLVGAVAFLVGMVAAGREALEATEVVMAVLVYGGFATVSMFKDYKDIDGDRSHGIKTIYVVLLARGWPRHRIHSLVTGIVVACLLVPVVWMIAALGAWVAAAVCGSLALVAGLALAHPRPYVAVERAIWLINAYLAVLVWGVEGVA